MNNCIYLELFKTLTISKNIFGVDKARVEAIQRDHLE